MHVGMRLRLDCAPAVAAATQLAPTKSMRAWVGGEESACAVTRMAAPRVVDMPVQVALPLNLMTHRAECCMMRALRRWRRRGPARPLQRRRRTCARPVRTLVFACIRTFHTELIAPPQRADGGNCGG